MEYIKDIWLQTKYLLKNYLSLKKKLRKELNSFKEVINIFVDY